MAKENPVLSALDALGFESATAKVQGGSQGVAVGAVAGGAVGAAIGSQVQHNSLVRFGVWENYAVCVQQLAATSAFITVAIRSDKKNIALSRELSRSLKAQGVKGLVLTPIDQKVLAATFRATFKKQDDATEQFRRFMGAVLAVLRENGLAPADTCAISGASVSDSLCLMTVGAMLSYQPVNGALVHEQSVKAKEKAEENQANGSYGLGLIGALLGMLAGVIPNLLTIIGMERIFSLLFALVPIAAFFGYKLFRGKMDKGAVVIVILVSLLGVLMIPYLEYVIDYIKYFGDSLGQSLQRAFYEVTDAAFFRDHAGDLLKLLLFMALGVFISLGVILGRTNGAALSNAQAQLNTLRPNPARSKDSDF